MRATEFAKIWLFLDRGGTTIKVYPPIPYSTGGIKSSTTPVLSIHIITLLKNAVFPAKTSHGKTARNSFFGRCRKSPFFRPAPHWPTRRYHNVQQIFGRSSSCVLAVGYFLLRHFTVNPIGRKFGVWVWSRSVLAFWKSSRLFDNLILLN